MATRWPRLSLALAATLAVGACGGGGGGGGSANPSTGASAGGGGGGSVSVAAVWTGQEQQSFQAVLDEFTKQTGISTSFKSTGDDIATYLGSQIAGGNPPDVAILPQPGLLASLAQQNNLKPLGDQPRSNLEKNFASVWTDLGSVNGTPYGVYWKASNKSTWWYDVKSFTTAGVQPPKTWNDMLQQAKTVAASGLPYVSIGGADGWVLTDWFENIYLRQAGPQMYDMLAQHKMPWTDPTVTRALKTFAQLLTTQGAVQGGASGALQIAFTDSVNNVLTPKPKAASVYEGDFVPGVATNQSLQAGRDFNFFNFPAIGGSGPAVVGGGDVAVTLSGSPNAQRLLAFLGTPQAAAIWAKRGGFTSPNKNLDPSVYPNDVTRNAAQAVLQAAQAGNFRFDMSDQAPPAFGGTQGQGEWADMQQLLRNPGNVAAVQQKLEADAAAAYGKG